MVSLIVRGVLQKNIELTGAIFTLILTKERVRDPSNETDSTRPKNLIDQDGSETSKLKSTQRALGETIISVRSPAVSQVKFI